MFEWFKTGGNIQIIFDRAVIAPGEYVTGRIEAHIKQDIEADELNIKFSGKEKTSIREDYTVNRDGQTHTEHRWHTDKVSLFKEEVTIQRFGGEKMSPGLYVYPFSFLLPQNLPSSFDVSQYKFGHVTGGIQYEAKAKFKKSGLQNIKKKQIFTVAKNLPIQPVAIDSENSKTFLFGSGELKMWVNLQRNVLSFGETVPIHVVVDNGSSRKVSGIKISLEREVHVSARHFHRKLDTRCARQVHDGVGKKDRLEQNYDFQLTGDIVPDIDGKLVQCHHYIIVKCDVKMAFDLECKFQVFINPPQYQSPPQPQQPQQPQQPYPGQDQPQPPPSEFAGTSSSNAQQYSNQYGVNPQSLNWDSSFHPQYGNGFAPPPSQPYYMPIGADQYQPPPENPDVPVWQTANYTPPPPVYPGAQQPHPDPYQYQYQQQEQQQQHGNFPPSSNPYA